MSRLAASYLTAATAIAGPIPWPSTRDQPPPPDPDRLAALRAERAQRKACNARVQQKAR